MKKWGLSRLRLGLIDEKAKGIVFDINDECVAVGLFNNNVQPPVPTTNAAKMVIHIAKVNGFIFPPRRKTNT